jgi:hypothetical protein
MGTYFRSLGSYESNKSSGVCAWENIILLGSREQMNPLLENIFRHVKKSGTKNRMYI